MPSIGPPPHAARLWRDLCCPELTIVTQLAANVFHRPKLPTFGAGALRPVPETVALPTRDSRIIRSHGAANVKVKNRAHRLVKHAMTDQFAHTESNVAVIFDGAAALRSLPKQVLRHWLA